MRYAAERVDFYAEHKWPAGELKMTHILKEFDARLFNILPEIEDADAFVRSSSLLSDTLEVVGELFVKHRITDFWGLALLHKHWDVAIGEFPSQLYIPESDEFHTRPILSRSSLSPSILRIERLASGGAALRPIEFSEDLQGAEAYEVLMQSGDLVSSLATELEALNAIASFGLISINKELGDNIELVESSYNSRISVLKKTPIDSRPKGRLIQTSWAFDPDITAARCKSKCFAACTVSPGGGHSRDPHKFYHDPNG